MASLLKSGCVDARIFLLIPRKSNQTTVYAVVEKQLILSGDRKSASV